MWSIVNFSFLGGKFCSVWGNKWEKCRKFNRSFPRGLKNVNQSALPTLKEKNKTALGTDPPPSSFCHSPHPSAKPCIPHSPTILKHMYTDPAFNQHCFSHSFSLSSFHSLPLVSVKPWSSRPAILIRDQTSVQSSVTSGSQQLQVRWGLGISLSLPPCPSTPAGQTFIHESNRIRWDYNTSM